MTTPDRELLVDVVSAAVLNAMRVASDALARMNVRHVVVGGLAVGAHGWPRATRGVDLLVGEEAFDRHGGGLVTVRAGLPIQVGGIAVDCLSVRDDEPFLGEALAAPPGSFAPAPVLVYMKLESPRSKDRQDGPSAVGIEMTNRSRRTAILGLLVLALSTAFPGRVAGQDIRATRLAMAGGELSAEAARKLELQVQAAPDDVDARTQLLGYYTPRAYSSEEARAARQQHVLWLIHHRPDAAILEDPYAHLDARLDGSAYREGKQAWLAQVDRQPANPGILGRAAGYLLLYDAATAESLYKRAEAAEPQNPRWSNALGHLYALGLSDKTGEGRQKAARTALDAYERSLERQQDAEGRRAALEDVAKSALEAGELEKARGYAEEMRAAAGDSSRRHWNYGNLIHHGHLILGRLALRAGDVQQAKEHLRAAGETPGSPQLDSFGPNMTLAKELLEKGERQAVLEYFELCARFWKRDELEAWAEQVRAGRIPDFRANLDY